MGIYGFNNKFVKASAYNNGLKSLVNGNSVVAAVVQSMFACKLFEVFYYLMRFFFILSGEYTRPPHNGRCCITKR